MRWFFRLVAQSLILLMRVGVIFMKTVFLTVFELLASRSSRPTGITNIGTREPIIYDARGIRIGEHSRAPIVDQ